MAGGSRTTSVDQRFAGVPIQTSLLGQPIPIGWGRGRVTPNLVDYLNFVATPHTTNTSSGGGKGGGSSSSSTSYTYTADVILLLCEGTVQDVVSIEKDSTLLTNGATTALAQAGLSLANGSFSQAPWSYLASTNPTHAIAYPGLAYLFAQGYTLGSDAQLSNHVVEVDFASQVGGGVVDANPAFIVPDALANPHYGLGWAPGLIASLTDYSNYCLASGLLLSPVIDQQTTGSDFLTQIMAETNSECCVSEGLLKIKPLGDAPVTGNGITWTPNLTPVYDLDDDDFLDPLEQEIVDQTDAYNSVQIEFEDRTNGYQTSISPADDLDNIVTFGLRKEDPVSMHDIKDPTVARLVAQLHLQRALYVRDLYHFRLPDDFAALEPNDYVTLSTSTDELQLNRQLVRILEIAEGAQGTDDLQITAEVVPGVIASAPLYAAHTANGFQHPANALPGNVAAPILFAPPSSLSVTGYEVWAAVAGAGPNWGGCDVWVSFDGTHYRQVGTINAPARYGALTASLAAGADPDTADTLSVSLAASGGALLSSSTADANAGGTLSALISGTSIELVSYATATLTGANAYNLTYLRRGQRNTPIAAHASGDTFVRLDSAIFRVPYDPANVGQTMSIKFASFNIYGLERQDLSTVAANTYALTSNPALPAIPGALSLAGGGTAWVGTSVNVICSPAARATSYRFDFYKADGTTLLRSITSTTPSASYTRDLAALDGLQRSYVVTVTAVNGTGPSGTSPGISIGNPAPPALSGVSASGGATVATVSATASTDADCAGYILFYSSTSGFNPSTSGSLVTSGTSSISLYTLPAGTYYGRIAAYDLWANDPNFLNLSAEQTFAITSGGGATPIDGGGYQTKCVADDTLILLANAAGDGPGGEVRAADLKAGDMVWTRHETTNHWGAYPVSAISFAHRPVYRCRLPGWSAPVRASRGHRFRMLHGILGRRAPWIRSEWIGRPDGSARVAQITVADAHTYVSNGALSHNVKMYQQGN